MSKDHRHRWRVVCRIDDRKNGCAEHFYLGPKAERRECDCGAIHPQDGTDFRAVHAETPNPRMEQTDEP